MSANPNAFVALFPVTWSQDNFDYLEKLHADRWREPISIRMASESETEAHIAYDDDAQSPDARPDTRLSIDPQLEDLEQLTDTGKEPLKQGEVALIGQHDAVWRVTVDIGESQGSDETSPYDGCLSAAHRIVRLMATFSEAGAPAVFVPAIQQMHGSEFVRSQTARTPPPAVDAQNSEQAVQSLTNLLVGAWDDTIDGGHQGDGDEEEQQPWMMTRGLTSFGLPELETPVDSGFNAAYFRLLDVASGMIGQQSPFPVGADLQLGPDSFVLREGPSGPEDEVVPTSGTFGVLSVIPKS